VDVSTLLLGGLIGLLTSAAATALGIALQRPHFTFKPSNGRRDPRGWKFVHIIVQNRASPWYGRFRDKTAYLCTAELVFRTDPAGENLFDPVSARWPRFQPQPLTASGGAIDLNAVIIPYRETMPAGDHAILDVAIKHQGDKQCYAFSNQSFIYDAKGFRHPALRLDAQQIYVQAIVYVEGKRYPSEWFVLENPAASLNKFVLRRL
jgi:hypothetical protein